MSVQQSNTLASPVRPNISVAEFQDRPQDTLSAFSSALKGSDQVFLAKLEAVQDLRERHNNPDTARKLGDLLLSSPDEDVQELANLALDGTHDPAGKDLLDAYKLLYGKGVKDFQVNADRLTELMKYPSVKDRLIETASIQTRGSDLAAHVLRNNLDDDIEQKLTATLHDFLDTGYSADWMRNDPRLIPYILETAQSEEAKAVIVRAYLEGDSMFATDNPKIAAAVALGTIDTEEVRELIVEQVYSPYQKWHFRRGIATAVAKQDDPELNEKLLPLVSGSVQDTIWNLSKHEETTTLGQLRRWAGLNVYEKERVYDTRVQVAIALKDSHPGLSLKVLKDAMNGISDVSAWTKTRCSFFATADAFRAIDELEID